MRDLRADLDDAVERSDHEAIKDLHRQYQVIKEEYRNAMEEIRERAQLTAAAEQPAPPETPPADDVPEQPGDIAVEQTPFDEAEVQEPMDAPPEDTMAPPEGGGTGEVAAKNESLAGPDSSLMQDAGGGPPDLVDDVPSMMDEFPDLFDFDGGPGEETAPVEESGSVGEGEEVEGVEEVAEFEEATSEGEQLDAEGVEGGKDEPPAESMASMMSNMRRLAGGDLPDTDQPDAPDQAEDGPAPPTMEKPAPPAAPPGPPGGGGGAPPPDEGGAPPEEEPEAQKSLRVSLAKCGDVPDTYWMVKSLSGGDFFPMFFNVLKGRLKGSGTGKRHKGSSHSASSGRPPGPGGYKYIERWYVPGEGWRYKYAKEPHPENHGAGENAVRAAAHFEPHTIETHPDLITTRAKKKKVRGRQVTQKRGMIKDGVQHAAHAFSLTVRAHTDGLTRVAEVAPTKQPPTIWKEKDKNGNWHVFKHHPNFDVEVYHKEVGPEDPGDPSRVEFSEEDASNLAGYKSYRAINHAIRVWGDRDGEPWLTLHEFTGQETVDERRKKFDDNGEFDGWEKTGRKLKRQVKKYKLSELEDNERGIAGESHFNEFTFRNRGNAERAGSFVSAFHRSEGHGNQPVQAFSGMGKDSSSLSDPTAQKLEKGEMLYRANKGFKEVEVSPERAVDDDYIDRVTVYQLEPVISPLALKRMTKSSEIASMYASAIGRAKDGYRKRFGEGMRPSTEKHLRESIEYYVSRALGITHIPGSTRFMSGYVPGHNLVGFLANSLSNKSTNFGHLVDGAKEFESREDVGDGRFVYIDDGGMSLRGDHHDELRRMADRILGESPDDLGGEQPADVYGDESGYEGEYEGGYENPYFEGYEADPVDVYHKAMPVNENTEEKAGDEDTRTVEAKRNIRRQYGSAGGTFTDDSEDVPMAVGEDSGVPSTEVIRRGLSMSRENEAMMTEMCKAIHDGLVSGSIDPSFVRRKMPSYKSMVRVLEAVKQARMMKSAAQEVAKGIGGSAIFFLCDLVDAIVVGDPDGVQQVFGEHTGDISKSLDCSEWHAQIQAREWFRRLKGHPVFKSAVHLSLAAEWEGEPEGEMFLRMARDSAQEAVAPSSRRNGF